MTRRLLLVHSSADRYGSDRSCAHIARGAKDAGWEVAVVVPGPGPLVAVLAEAGVTVHQLDPLVLRRAGLRPTRVPSTVTGWVRAHRGLRAFARRHRADVVHTNTAPTLGGALLARRWGAAHVWHVRELFSEPRPVRAAFERLLGTADVVLCNSAMVRDQLRRPALRDRARVVHSAAEVPDVPTATPLSGPGVTVVCVARLNAWKGQDTLIEAARRLRHELPGLRVRLVGDVWGSEDRFREALLAQVRAAGLDGVVVFDGERDDVPSILADADVFVLPSRRPEPFGIALVEAMVLGRPVVATAAGGPLEIVEDSRTGLLVPPGDPGALAGAIERLVRDPEAARSMGDRARDAATRFSVETMVAGVLAAYEEALERHSAGR